MEARSGELPALWGLAVAVPALVLAADTWRFFGEPLRWRGWAVPYVDLPYQLALVGELSHRWPPEYPQVAGDRLYYHWFAHAWIAHIGSVSGTSLDVLLLRFVPVVVTVAVPALLAVVAVRITGRVWTGPLAVLLAFGVTELDVWHVLRGDLPLHHASPTHSLGVILLLTALPLLAARWRGQVPLGWSTALLLPLLVVAGGAKGSVLPVLLAGCLLALAGALLRRTPRRAVVALDTALVGAVLLVLMGTLFGGGDGGMSTTPLTSLGRVRADSFLGEVTPTTPQLLVVTVLSLAAMLVPLIGAFGVITDRETRRDPVLLLLAGCAVSGLGAVVVLAHRGLSQFYFLRTAGPLLAVLAAWGLAILLERARPRAWTVVVGAVSGVVAVAVVRVVTGPVDETASPFGSALLALSAFLLLVVMASMALGVTFSAVPPRRHRVLALVSVAVLAAGLVPTLERQVLSEPRPKASIRSPGAFDSSQVRAARFIRQHSDPFDLVATNRHCRRYSGRICDPRRFFVAAYTERRVLVEGWGYTYTSQNQVAIGEDGGRKHPFYKADVLEVNDRFVTQPTTGGADRLREMGVRWIFVDRTAPHAETLEPFAKLRLRTRWASVYELVTP